MNLSTVRAMLKLAEPGVAGDIILTAHVLLATGKNWCRNSYACKVDGTSCGPCDPEAAKWCVIGAIYYAASQTMRPDYAEICVSLLNALAPEGIAQANDRAQWPRINALLNMAFDISVHP